MGGNTGDVKKSSLIVCKRDLFYRAGCTLDLITERQAGRRQSNSLGDGSNRREVNETGNNGEDTNGAESDIHSGSKDLKMSRIPRLTGKPTSLVIYQQFR
jgi:hypothetical protein